MGRAFKGYIMPYVKTILSVCAAAALALVNATAAEAPVSLTATNKQGAVELVMLAEPAQIRLDRDVLLTIRVRAPENITVRLPDITPRLTGSFWLEHFQIRNWLQTVCVNRSIATV